MEPNLNSSPLVFVQPVALELILEEGLGYPLPGELRYDNRDPYAVTLVVGGRESASTWIFARELLEQGLLEAAGDGDVHVWPGCADNGNKVILIEVCAEDGDVVLAADPADVEDFVTAIFELVPAGTESENLDIDTLVEAIFASVANERSDG